MELEQILGLGTKEPQAADLESMDAAQLRTLVRKLASELRTAKDLGKEIGALRETLESAKSFLADVKKSHAKLLARI